MPHLLRWAFYSFWPWFSFWDSVKPSALAQVVAIPYLLLNVIGLIRGIWEIARHSKSIHNWRISLSSHGDWPGIFLVLHCYPKLALGLSGFETRVSVMPLITDDELKVRGDSKGTHTGNKSSPPLFCAHHECDAATFEHSNKSFDSRVGVSGRRYRRRKSDRVFVSQATRWCDRRLLHYRDPMVHRGFSNGWHFKSFWSAIGNGRKTI